jgi:glucitol operon activator protein
MENLGFGLILFSALVLTAVSALGQHKYYVRTIRRLAREHSEPGRVLVSGRAKGRLRGAIAILVLRANDQTIEGAAVMEGASILARFKDRPDWVGHSARGSLPDCSALLAAAVAEARKQIPARFKTSAARSASEMSKTDNRRQSATTSR